MLISQLQCSREVVVRFGFILALRSTLYTQHAQMGTSFHYILPFLCLNKHHNIPSLLACSLASLELRIGFALHPQRPAEKQI
jgi:hypothetical protein